MQIEETFISTCLTVLDATFGIAVFLIAAFLFAGVEILWQGAEYTINGLKRVIQNSKIDLNGPPITNGWGDIHLTCMASINHKPRSWTSSFKDKYLDKLIVCNCIDCQLGDHGLRYPWRYIIDRNLFNKPFNDESGRRNNLTLYFQTNLDSVCGIVMAASWIADFGENVHC